MKPVIWDRGMIERLRAMRRAGTPLLLCAERIGVGFATCVYKARELGLAVPRDLSIAGINDAEFAAYLTPPLTTMHLPADEIGIGAAEYLLGCVDALPTVAATEVEASLIVRASTAPAICIGL